MSDLRGIPASDYLAMGRLVALAGAPAGFTVGNRYWPIALVVDCQPVPPVPYIVAANDNGQLIAAPAGVFRFAIDNLAP